MRLQLALFALTLFCGRMLNAAASDDISSFNSALSSDFQAISTWYSDQFSSSSGFLATAYSVEPASALADKQWDIGLVIGGAAYLPIPAILMSLNFFN